MITEIILTTLLTCGISTTNRSVDFNQFSTAEQLVFNESSYNASVGITTTYPFVIDPISVEDNSTGTETIIESSNTIFWAYFADYKGDSTNGSSFYNYRKISEVISATHTNYSFVESYNFLNVYNYDFDFAVVGTIRHSKFYRQSISYFQYNMSIGFYSSDIFRDCYIDFNNSFINVNESFNTKNVEKSLEKYWTQDAMLSFWGDWSFILPLSRDFTTHSGYASAFNVVNFYDRTNITTQQYDLNCFLSMSMLSSGNSYYSLPCWYVNNDNQGYRHLVQEITTYPSNFQFLPSFDFIIRRSNLTNIDISTGASDVSYQQGYTAGFRDGNQQANNRGFLGLMGAIADVPIRIIRNLFNFDLFGVNVLTLVMSILTGLLVIWLIKRFIK